MSDGPRSSPIPFRPPRTGEDRLAWLRLIRSRRVGAVTFHRLMAEHGTAQAALHALPGLARSAGVAGYAPCPPEVITAEITQARKLGARMLCLGEASYPPALAELPDAPPLLWVIGDSALLTRPMVALVGARNASSLGARMARRLAEGLAEAGYVVVSGLARGVDAAAHEAALAGGTIAVQAGGVDVIYPAENAALAEAIARQGLRLSEQPMGMAPLARHFPLRNRIISGLSRAVVVVEAAARSGSLITARGALDQGREVLAVPGHPLDQRAAGCNLLIRDGATLVRDIHDVLEVLGAARAPEPALPLAPPEPPRTVIPEAAILHQAILARLGPSPLAEDQLIRDLAIPAARIAPELLALELEGHIQRHPGGLLSLAV